MKILALSDLEVPAIYSNHIRERFKDANLVVSCGDLSAQYLEYVVSTLNVPVYFVQGNHVSRIENAEGLVQTEAQGAINLHKNVVYDRENDLILAGIEGSLPYNHGPYQYSQRRMWAMVSSLVPKLMQNKTQYGRYLDVFVTHAAPTGIHDADDPAHQGVDAFRWLIENFKPQIHLHGHMHRYNPLSPIETIHKETRVINAYAYREIEI
jgi:Icc-related predicted phosphoesterase